ncbi:MAG: hypothetical protein ACP5NQ_06725 [Vulcanisaeta sp.]
MRVLCGVLKALKALFKDYDVRGVGNLVERVAYRLVLDVTWERRIILGYYGGEVMGCKLVSLEECDGRYY